MVQAMKYVLIVWARGPWGPLGPSYRIHVESVTTYCQAKLPTVRHAPNRSIDLHPTSAYFAPNRFRIHAPNNRIHAPNFFGERGP